MYGVGRVGTVASGPGSPFSWMQDLRQIISSLGP